MEPQAADPGSGRAGRVIERKYTPDPQTGGRARDLRVKNFTSQIGCRRGI
jgi:hypothetical protein